MKFFKILNETDPSDDFFRTLTNAIPNAIAVVKGANNNGIKGSVKFFQTNDGVLVVSEIINLPRTNTNIFAEHIHEGNECVDNFTSAGEHYNPTNVAHPLHAGDLPPLFSNNGYALSVVLTNRFNVSEIIDRTVIIHDSFDDFTSQPSGNSGARIACGVIKNYI